MERDVERVSGFDGVREAYREFRAEPLLVTGAVSDWPLLDGAKGSVLQQLEALAGECVVDGLHLFYDASDGTQCSHEVERISLSELLSRAAVTGRSDRSAWYLQWRDLPHPPAAEDGDTRPATPSAASAPHASALMRAVRLPGLIRPAALAQVNAWIGRSRTSHLHFDGVDNFLAVAHGRKEVLLFSPWQLADLYPQLEPEQRWKSGARSALYPRDDAASFPRLRAAPRLRAVIEAGDALWIPAGWWHEVLTPEVCCAFNFWFKPHDCARLRPTLLHLRSDLYAKKYSQRVSDSGAEAPTSGENETTRRDKRARTT